MTVHFIYAKGLRTNAPHSITNELAPRLRELGDVQVYDLAEMQTIRPAQGGGDILLGHPHPDPRSVFQASFVQPGWKKRVVICPFSHRLPELNGWMEALVDEADLFLAITGKYWFETVDASLFSHWKHKMRRLDLAVNPRWFPPIKKAWNPAGSRRFLYIGYTGPAKGTDYLCALAEANPAIHFAWMGGGFMPSARIETLGPCDFNLPEAAALVGSFDFVISCGRSDANPATLLEALAWGLVPVCTPQSGYQGEPWLVNIPNEDVAGASAVLQRLNEASESELDERVARGRSELARHYTWDRFGRDVVAALREDTPARPQNMEWQTRAEANKTKLREILEARR